MTIQEALDFIHGCYRKAQPGTQRTRELLQRLGDPQKQLKFIHIAGTNGKGSTAAMTASILTQAGYRTGLFTSPYIYRFNERMQIDGEQISDEDVIEALQQVKPQALQCREMPTEFEVVTGMAMVYFAKKKCDIVVLEVGMGGLNDATNTIDAPEVAVITNIGLDHTDVLGDTLEKIAENKAGIFKPGCSAVVYRGTPEVEAVYETICREKNIPLTKADFTGLTLKSHSLEGQVFHCGERRDLSLPLLGDHQLHNAAVVLSIADTLISRGWKLSEENIRTGIAQVRWPGRFDIAGRDPLFIIDGGHNPQCIEALAKNIRDYLPGKTIIALTGVLADKDYAKMYRPIMPYIREFVCVTPPSPRKMEAAVLAQHLRSAGAAAIGCDSMDEGVRLAREKAGTDGCVLCFGSLYTIGDIKAALERI